MVVGTIVVSISVLATVATIVSATTEVTRSTSVSVKLRVTVTVVVDVDAVAVTVRPVAKIHEQAEEY